MKIKKFNLKCFLGNHDVWYIPIPNEQRQIEHCKKCNKYRMRHFGIGCVTGWYTKEQLRMILTPGEIKLLNETKEGDEIKYVK